MKSLFKAIALSLALALASGSAFAGSSEGPVQQSAETFVYLKCPSTSLELDQKSLMSNDGDFYSISYKVESNGLKSVSESCSFVVTDAEGFADDASIYVADLKEGVAVKPGEYYGLIPAKAPSEDSLEQAPSFDIKYDYFGAFAVYFNLEKLEFFVTPLIFID